MNTNGDAVRLESQPRTVLGKKVKRLRSEGTTPIHLYGPGGPPLALQAESTHLRSVVERAGRTSPVSVVIDGDPEETLSFVRDVAVHPTTMEIEHVDFLRVDETRLIELPINVTVVGDSPATVGGLAVVTQVLRTLYVMATPFNAPDGIEADVSGLMHIGSVLRVSDLNLPEGVEASGHPDDVIARVQKQREAEVFEDQLALIEEGEEEAVEGEEGVEAEEGAEGEGAEEEEAEEKAE